MNYSSKSKTVKSWFSVQSICKCESIVRIEKKKLKGKMEDEWSYLQFLL